MSTKHIGLDGCMATKHIGLDVLCQFRYDEVNGGVVRITSRRKKIVPKPNSKGYIMYGVTNNSHQIQYSSHRLAYLLNYPDMDQALHIDHINGIKTDNRIENLRLVTNQQNQFNRKAVKGFYWNIKNQKFQVHICINYKVLYIGQYETILDARAAYLRAKQKYHVIEGVCDGS